MMNVEGCEDAKADWERGWAWAKYDPAKTNPEALVKAINDSTAFEASIPEKKKTITWSITDRKRSNPSVRVKVSAPHIGQWPMAVKNFTPLHV